MQNRGREFCSHGRTVQNNWHPNLQPCQFFCRSTTGNTPHNQHNHIWCSHFSGCFQGGCLGIIFKILAGRLAFHKLQLWQARTTGLKQVAKLQELSCVAIFNGSNLASIQWSGFATGNTLIQISCEVCSLQGVFQTLRFGGSRCGASLSSQVCSKCHCFYRSRSNALLVPQSLSFRLLGWNQASPFLSCDFTAFDFLISLQHKRTRLMQCSQCRLCLYQDSHTYNLNASKRLCSSRAH